MAGDGQETVSGVRLIRTEKCRTCGTRWMTWDDGSCSLLPGDACEGCCDNVPMDLEPVMGRELEDIIRRSH